MCDKKVCKKCKIEKELNKFNKDKDSKDGHRYRCRECTKIEYNKYYENNKEKEITRQINYQVNNRESTREYRRKRYKERYDSDILYKLVYNVRNRTKMFLKTINFNIKGGSFNIIGCSPIELKEYIENKFTDGMSWDNHGFYGWHIDHIIPISTANNEADIYKLSHYTNLQPLWAIDNFKKGKKII